MSEPSSPEPGEATPNSVDAPLSVPEAGRVRTQPQPGSELLQIVRALIVELRGNEEPGMTLTLDSALDADLGLDSLARVELFMRVEREFGVQLPEALFERARTLNDLLEALSRAPARASGISRPSARLPPVTAGAITRPPTSLATLDQVLRWHAEQRPGFAHLTILGDRDDEVVTYAQLWGEATIVAGNLEQHGIAAGDRVALMLPTSRDYFVTFFGVLLAGAIPVPLYPPARLNQMEEHVKRHAHILLNAGAVMLITTAEMRGVASMFRSHAGALRKTLTSESLLTPGSTLRAVKLAGESLALLQYTSGSTGQPKGVTLTHTNVIANIRALGIALRVHADDVFVSWLPLYHDMGLIGAWLGTLYFGLPLVVMSPLSFLTRPVRWLEAIHRYRGTMSAAPNFAYELCLKRITKEELHGIDLSSWRVAMNGAEPVMPSTLSQFEEHFSQYGLSSTAMTPVYGLAECAVGLCVPPMDRGPLIDTIQREPLMRTSVAMPAGSGDPEPLRFASCGRPLPGYQVRIVDEHGAELPERREGRLEFRGPSATSGYFNNPAASQLLRSDGWLDSGDRAYLARGEIYITGRIKDIIIRAGRHIHPDEIESAIGAIPGIRKGCVAVFGSTDAASGTERLIVVAETRQDDLAERDMLRHAIIETVVRLVGEPPDETVLANPHTVLKTSSGKIRRASTRAWYESGRRARGRPTGWMPLSLMTGSAIQHRCLQLRKRSFRLIYASYFWVLFLLIGSTAVLLSLLPASHATLWRTLRRLARIFIRLSGLRVESEGLDRLTARTPHIVASNHTSYLDGLFLLAALPGPYCFIAKRELARTGPAGWLLRRMGTVFVTRSDTRCSLRDAQHLIQVAADRSCIFFPEGTFTREPGLMPFHLGAFSIAVAARVPMVPVALSGVRRVLPDGSWFPRRAPVRLCIGEAVDPVESADDFHAAIELRNRVRQWISARCDELDRHNLSSHTEAFSAPLRDAI